WRTLLQHRRCGAESTSADAGALTCAPRGVLPRADAVIQSTNGVKDGFCFADPGADDVNQLAVVVSLQEGADINKVAVDLYKGMVRADLPFAIRRIYVSGNVPRNLNGKATRHLAVQAVKGIRPFLVRIKQ
ncbi:MAG: hypothetical protein ACXWLK_03350, partial [Rhizomicrobium sp.]